MGAIAQPPPMPPEVTGQMGAPKQPFADVGGMLADKVSGEDKGKPNPLGNVAMSMDAVKRILTNISDQNDVAAPYVKRILAITEEMMTEINSKGAPGTPKPDMAPKAPTGQDEKIKGSIGTSFPG